MSDISRRQFLASSAVPAAGLVLLHATSARGALGAAACTDSCRTVTAWMLAPEWTSPTGPKHKTSLVSRASRAAAANRIARTRDEAIDMNLHLCSFAPAMAVEVCESRFDAAFTTYARDWQNPWNGKTVRLLDRRWVPADVDPLGCSASAGHPASANQLAGSGSTTKADDRRSGGLAFTGAHDRRLLMMGIGAVAAGVALRGLPRLRGAYDPPHQLTDVTESADGQRGA